MIKALAPGTGALIAARAVQGAGAAIVTPLAAGALLALLVPGKRRAALQAASKRAFASP